MSAKRGEEQREEQQRAAAAKQQHIVVLRDTTSERARERAREKLPTTSSSACTEQEKRRGASPGRIGDGRTTPTEQGRRDRERQTQERATDLRRDMLAGAGTRSSMSPSRRSVSTSTLRRESPVLSMLVTLVTLSFLLSANVASAAQVVAPTNSSSSSTVFELKLWFPSMIYTVILSPLTPDAGQQNVGPLKGTIMLTTDSTATNLDNTQIAYISCDPSPNDAEDGTYRAATGRNPVAVVLYSKTSSSCSLQPGAKGTAQFLLVYSMTTANSSAMFEGLLRQPPTNQALIAFDPNASTGAQIIPSGVPTSSGSGGGSGSSLGASPTTTVAMIILYSITGLVTALFLIIIATGAIRAHRHPERYGPRLTGTLGRQRQSRAKGLARAVLDSIPIVKFGERDDHKPPGGDVELGTGNQQRRLSATTGGDGPSETTGEGGARLSGPEGGARGGVEGRGRGEGSGGGGEDGSSADRVGGGERRREEDIVSPLEPPSTAAAAAAAARDGSDEEIQPSVERIPTKDEGLSCSICTEDFVKGEDIRVLPCNHKYHPDCVDPWLLNVSGTCPLW
ncbi:hypothetical protein GP486_007832 [Trichoglossum hirsutum]|uniref:RING-type domain-containing protein n=1 Tax=Trichoglossum hirsutum TaxID=265104 RepID=A0A9P8IHR1_9PEZI|nr:hypothetical protein GP486_007832 [Trichoglossum hirsutum]